MTSPSRILCLPPSARLVPIAGRAGPDRIQADFRSALSQAADAASAPIDETVPRHRVRTGDTLYGIARAQLSASGQADSPRAAMHYARQIARTNQIADPDRILPGQSLVLPAVAESVARTGERPASGAPRPVEGGASAGAAEHRLSAALAAYGAEAVRAAELHSEEIVWPAAVMPGPGDPPSGMNAGRGGGPAGADAPLPPSDLPAPAVPVLRDLIGERALTLQHRAESGAGRGGPALESSDASRVSSPSGTLPDIVYKGVVGKVLDHLPLAPGTRTALQQANAVVGGSLVGRSLTTLAGLSNPILTVAGLVWGLVSAQKIGAAQAAPPPALASSQPETRIAARE